VSAKWLRAPPPSLELMHKEGVGLEVFGSKGDGVVCWDAGNTW
jgi:hypothetical protein